ncbi:MAG TPA: tRNA pseudouridine(55) synthase TruB [Bavariicoccus seileri]|uniref:tRNA pseudouridine synthase B n=1 Tax=Bavariicoccus seileri TaxID=549685 RepID=A0A3D4S5B9_9ENTE|nr:tRNA pseudouridine(55) synthase TruB [Bavariicoccus seileri]HCS93662.1 tRNA pseudouridine(55) synthase TruB [Bavariicoccus seileri]
MDGLVVLYKGKGMTSHDCVNRVRRILKTKKVGHSGTLDPMVEGVLPLGIGKGTKTLEYLLDYPKTYRGTVLIGIATETEDIEGKIIDRRAVEHPFSESIVDHAIKSMVGDIIQIPPYYSAVKVKGKKLYEYARNNQVVERPRRKAHIYQFNRTSTIHYDDKDKTASFDIIVTCSKGTYIRTLLVDLGQKLGFPATMSYLMRTESGGFDLDQSVRLEEFEKEPPRYLLPIDEALKKFHRKEIPSNLETIVINGGTIEIADISIQDFPFVFTKSGKPVAVYDHHPTKDHLIKPLKMFI